MAAGRPQSSYARKFGCRLALCRQVLKTAMQTSGTAGVHLYWIPLGAGDHCVRFNGRVFEAIDAARRHRQRCELYHAALVAKLGGDRYTTELAPAPDADEASRGVVATGAVGSRYIGWLRLFRYEVRCSRGGSLPDLGEAVGGPLRLTSEARVVRRLLDLVATVPTPAWGRDERKAGEMWNSNSMIAWLIATAGPSTDHLRPPPRGRAPGARAGLEVARRGGAYVRGGVPVGRLPPPYDFTWAFVLRDRADGTTRLVVRERYPAGHRRRGGFDRRRCRSQDAKNHCAIP
jgi:hypothetical protein